jgi:hypothetical protein
MAAIDVELADTQIVKRFEQNESAEILVSMLGATFLVNIGGNL